MHPAQIASQLAALRKASHKMTSLTDISNGQMQDFERKLDKAGVDGEVALACLRDPMLARIMANAVCREMAQELPEPMIPQVVLGTCYATPEQQLLNVKRYFGEFFTAEHISDAHDALPDVESHEDIAVTLVPHLGILEQTVQALLRAAGHALGGEVVRNAENRFGGALFSSTHPVRLVDDRPFAANRLAWGALIWPPTRVLGVQASILIDCLGWAAWQYFGSTLDGERS